MAHTINFNVQQAYVCSHTLFTTKIVNFSHLRDIYIKRRPRWMLLTRTLFRKPTVTAGYYIECDPVNSSDDVISCCVDTKPERRAHKDGIMYHVVCEEDG